MNIMKKNTILFLALVLMTTLPAISHARGKTQAVRQDVELVVHTAAIGLGGIVKDIEDVQSQIALIQAFISPVRFFPDNSGYFYVYNLQGICVAHATQANLIGKDLSQLTDTKGFKAIQALTKKAKEGGGFVEYTWDKPGADGLYPKLGYVEPIPGTNLLIGSGIYLPKPF